MNASELRKKYLEFFKSKGHAVIPGASLIPEHDPTVLFTTAGMHPLVPFLLGEKHPAGKRLVNVQKCLRTGDIEEVGNARHLTFFEMLGNWSLGDYWKKEAIEWSFEFLTDKNWLGLNPQRLYVTVFKGGENSPADEESIEYWKKQFEKAGIKAEICPYNQPINGNTDFRIFPLPAKDNWWGPAGQTGPCGPCSEMFYDLHPEKGKMKKTFDEEVEEGRIIEIWNDVFMEFNKIAENKFENLKQKNVDTGMGVERAIVALNGLANVYETELFKPLIQKIEEISGQKYQSQNIRPFRIIADHLKAATFILAEGIEPSNVERGYVLRRFIRRAIRYGKQLNMNGLFTFKVMPAVFEIYGDIYPEVLERKDFIEEQLMKEERKFTGVLEDGLYKLKGAIIGIRERDRKDGVIVKDEIHRLSGQMLFDLYSTHGFPIEMSLEEIDKILDELGRSSLTTLEKNRLKLEFQEAFKKHQEMSRVGAEQKFKGGLADHSEQTIKYHTAAHLMLAALRQVLGNHVFQKGSNITAERLRFDFSHPEKMTPEQIKKVEDLVNEKIRENLPVKMDEMSLEEAKMEGAMGVFESRYGERVKVYSIGDPQAGSGSVFSREICGGPHVQNTGILGKFKIVKEEASSAGVRRIKAILE